MDSTSIILLYESLAKLMQKMLAAANNNDWETLISIDHECTQYITALKSSDADVKKLTGEHKERQISLIRQILKDNQTVRTIIQPNMDELSKKIQSNNNEQKLLKTYSNLGG